MGNSAKRDNRSANIAERQAKALAMRRSGANLRDIAKALGMSVGAIHGDIKTAIEAIPREEALQVLSMELQRLDAMFAAIWPMASGGDLDAIERALRIMKRRAEYLGLDAPKRQELAGVDGAPIAVDTTVTKTVTVAQARDVMHRIFGSIGPATDLNGIEPRSPSDANGAPDELT